MSGSSSPNWGFGSLTFQKLESTSAIKPASATKLPLRDFAKRLLALQRSLRQALRSSRSYTVPGGPGRASAASAIEVELSTESSATSLWSTAEVNSTATSYSTSDPEFGGSSTSSPFISGTYSGENGDNTLDFTATLGGIVGLTPISIEVSDQEGTTLDTISLGLDPAGTTYTLSNGLEVTFGSGSIQQGDSFQVEVSSTTGSAVRPDNPFDGVGDAGANLEAGSSVSAGAFEINGVSISVAASDTLNAVLSQINASAAGVNAVFDTDTETVQLTRTTDGPEDIALANDTSGLLAALKLEGATPVLGTLDESQELIGEVAALSGIQSGDLLVNGVTLTVDILQDSLVDVIERINSSGAGATAAFDEDAGAFTIVGANETALVLGDGSSGFFSGVGVEPTTYEIATTRSTTRFRDEGSLQRRLVRFAEAYADAFKVSSQGAGSGKIKSTRDKLASTVAGVFKNLLGKSGEGNLSSGLGISFKSSTGPFRTFDLNPSRLNRALGGDVAELSRFLFADHASTDSDGLLVRLDDEIDKALNQIGKALGDDALGLNLDVTA